MKDSQKIAWGAIGFEGIALFGLLIPVVHGFAGLLDIEIMHGNAMNQVPEVVLFMYRFSAYFGEPGLMFSLILGGFGFTGFKQYISGSGTANTPSVTGVVWSLYVFALLRILMIISSLNYNSKLLLFTTTHDFAMIQFASMLKGLSALIEAVAGTAVSIFLIRFFSHDIINIFHINHGKSGAKLVLLSVLLGVATKTLAIYVFPEILSGAFIISQLLKCIGLSMIALHLYLFATVSVESYSKN